MSVILQSGMKANTIRDVVGMTILFLPLRTFEMLLTDGRGIYNSTRALDSVWESAGIKLKNRNICNTNNRGHGFVYKLYRA